MFIALQIILGLLLLTAGGDALVRGSVAIAQKMNVSKLVIGLTLVGFGTSMPEMVTSINAALAGSPGIAIGNVVGSNICNILLILGLAAIISPMVAPWMNYRRDSIIMIGASLLLLGVCIAGELSRFAGGILFLSLVLYVVGTFLMARKDSGKDKELENNDDIPNITITSTPLNLGITLGGLALLMVGANQLVTGSIELAKIAGISDAVIGLTIVAVGTSLPELVTSVMAAIKKHADVAIGNIIGSNIFNILGILGVTALVKPITIPSSILAIDIWVMLGASGILIALIATTHQVSRIVGSIMVGSYTAYVLYLLALVE